MQIDHLTSWITVDNCPLPEYDVKYSADGTQATCWVPSEVGKEFIVCWKDLDGSSSLGSKLLVNGNKCRGAYLFPVDSPEGQQRLMRRPTGIVKEAGVSTSATTRRSFTFAKQELTDDDAFLNLSGDPGEIRITISQIQIGARKEYTPLPFGGSLKVHERVKKAVEHGVTLGQEVLTKPKGRRKTSHVRTLATFIFKYRPMERLIADGIAPPKYSPLRRRSRATDMVDLSDLADDESERVSPTSRNRQLLKEEPSSFDDMDRFNPTPADAQGMTKELHPAKSEALGDSAEVIDLR